MPQLTIVQQSEPSKAEKVRLRMKRRPGPDGVLQCNRCGGRSVLNIKHGVIIKGGRKQGGTVIEKDICESCWKDGVRSEMIPEIKLTK